MSVFFTPQNDAELNAFSASMRQATQKYFNFAPGAKRSNNWRDCLCEGLGFHGGYQQLQALWRTRDDWDPLSAQQSLIIENTAGIPANLTMVVMQPFAQRLHLALNHDFPCKKGDFLNNYAGFFGNTGWTTQALNTPEAKKHATLWDSLQRNDSFPLFYGNRLVGYAADSEGALIINGLLMGFYVESTLDGEFMKYDRVASDHPHAFFYRINTTTPLLAFGANTRLLRSLMVSLRVSGRKHSLKLPADRVYLCGKTLRLHRDSGDVVLHAEGDCANLAGCLFDHCSVYRFDGEAITLHLGRVDIEGSYLDMTPSGDVEMAEWFPMDYLSYRPFGAEPDELDELDLTSHLAAALS